jgi:heme/copper-type cytochrome/quinol oxidase subunit 4
MKKKKNLLWIIAIVLLGISALFHAHPSLLERTVSTKYYGIVEFSTAGLAGVLFAIFCFLWLSKKKDDTDLGLHWIAWFIISLVIIFGGIFLWKGDPRDYFSNNKTAFVEESVPQPATTQTDNVPSETVDDDKSGISVEAQAGGNVVDQDSLEIIKLKKERDNEKTSFNEDSATQVKILKEAELRCERRKAQKEALIAEINMYKSKRQQLRNNPPVFNCDSYSRSTEAVKQASMQDFARLKEISDARKKGQ